METELHEMRILLRIATVFHLNRTMASICFAAIDVLMMFTNRHRKYFCWVLAMKCGISVCTNGTSLVSSNQPGRRRVERAAQGNCSVSYGMTWLSDGFRTAGRGGGGQREGVTMVIRQPCIWATAYLHHALLPSSNAYNTHTCGQIPSTLLTVLMY